MPKDNIRPCYDKECEYNDPDAIRLKEFLALFYAYLYFSVLHRLLLKEDRPNTTVFRTTGTRTGKIGHSNIHIMIEPKLEDASALPKKKFYHEYCENYHCWQDENQGVPAAFKKRF